MKTPKICFVSGPYTASTQDEQENNVAQAVEVAKQVMLKHMVPIVPHKITENWDFDPQFADWQHSDWMNKFCLPLLAKCDAICMVPGWEKSKGATMEYEYAIANGIEVIEL